MHPNSGNNKIQEQNITPQKYYGRKTDQFLKGPVPMPWLITAANLSGKALHIGVALWFWAGMKKSETFVLPRNAIKNLGVSRQTCSTHLKAMEQAGLLSIEPQKGKKPKINLFRKPRLPGSVG